MFHNLRGYDKHHLVHSLAKLRKEINCVANNMEKNIAFSAGGIKFIDSLNFLQGSLDSLVGATPKENLKITSTFFRGGDLFFKKGISPYQYIESETALPDIAKFFSKLNDENISDEEYEHAQKVWEVFECKTVGD